MLLGRNSKVTDPLDIPPGSYGVSWQAKDTEPHGSKTPFVVYIQGQESIQGQERIALVNAVLPTTNSGQSSFTSGGGSFIVDVETAAATWQITFMWLSR